MATNTGEKFLYIENKTGSNFIIGFTVMNMIAYVLSMGSVAVNYNMFWFSMINIFLTLFTFLLGTKQKQYSKPWTYIGFGVALIQILQILFYPELYTDQTEIMVIYGLLILSVISIVIGSLITLKRINIREESLS